MTPAYILAETEGRTEVTEDDVKETNKLFLDAKTSARILSEQSSKYVY